MDVQEEMNTSQRLLTKSIEIVNLTAEASEKKFKVCLNLIWLILINFNCILFYLTSLTYLFISSFCQLTYTL